MIAIDGVLYGADQLVARYVNDLCGAGFEPGNVDAALGILGPDGLIGGVVFSNHLARLDITVTVACQSIMCGHPRIIARILAYPFEQLGLQRVTAEIEASNLRSLRNARAMGFVEEGVKRGTDVVVLGLLRDEFPFKRYMPGVTREEPITSAAA